MAFERLVKGIAENVGGVAVIGREIIEIIPEHQPAHVTPEKIDEDGAVGIRGLVCVVMMSSMDRNPAGGSFLQVQQADQGQAVLKPSRTGETAMREQAVVTEIDAEAAEEIDAEHGEREARPAEEGGYESQQRNQMIENNSQRHAPVDLHALLRRGTRDLLRSQVLVDLWNRRIR